MIEDLPDFVPLLAGLRERLVATRRQDLADTLLPRRQLDDRNDNVRRLLRVLDRDGSAGLLSGAMDGGVTVELLDGRRTALGGVQGRPGGRRRVPRGREGPAGHGVHHLRRRPAGHLHDEGTTTGVEGVLAGSGKPDGGTGQVKSTGGAAGAALASGASRRRGAVSRGQLGMKTVADAGAAAVARMRVPVRASLELYRGGTRVALVRLDGLTLTHRVLRADLEALSRAELPARDVAAVARGSHAPTRGPRPTGRLARERREPTDGGPGQRIPRRHPGTAAPDVRDPGAGGGARFRDRGQAAAYALNEAVSTEWMIAALPCSPRRAPTCPGARLRRGGPGPAGVPARPAARRPGPRRGRQDGLRDDRPEPPGGTRPTQRDGQSAADHGRSARGLVGAGLLNADQFRLNQLMANAGGSGGTTDATADASGSMPVHKPKSRSVLVQFTLDVRAVARVTGRIRSGTTATATRETTLARPWSSACRNTPSARCSPPGPPASTTRTATWTRPDDHGDPGRDCRRFHPAALGIRFRLGRGPLGLDFYSADESCVRTLEKRTA